MVARASTWGGEKLSGWAGALLLGLAALVIRLYQIGRNPFWFDELFIYQISLASPSVIIQQGWYEPYPPLYYFLIKLTSGFGLVHAEWAWRWPSVVAGSAAVAGLYWLLRRLTSRGPALLAALLLAISPMQVYFSQEARPYIVVMLVVVASTAVVWRLSNHSEGASGWRWWLAWLLLTLLGLYQAYNYAVVWLLQAAYVMWLKPDRRKALLVVGITGLAFVPLLYLIGVNLRPTMARAATTAPLTLPFLARMAFGGDPNRYGEYSGQVILAMVLGGLALAGLLRAMRPGASSFERYLALQVVAPLLGFFGLIDGVLHAHIPSFQARQFIVLLPAFYGLVGLGLEALFSLRPTPLGRLTAIGLFAAAVIAGWPGLERYWTMTKSPEGDLALAVRQQAQPGDAIVSLHYSLNGALSFYAPSGVIVYTQPVAGPSGYDFSNTLGILYTTQIARPFHLADIRRSKRIWVLSRAGNLADVVAVLSQGCSVAVPQAFAPFELLRLDDCPPA